MDNLGTLHRASRLDAMPRPSVIGSKLRLGRLWCSTALMTGVLLALSLPASGLAADLTIDDGRTVVVDRAEAFGSVSVSNGDLQVGGILVVTDGDLLVSGEGSGGTMTVSGFGSTVRARQLIIGDDDGSGHGGSGHVVFEDGAQLVGGLGTPTLVTVIVGRGTGSVGTILVTGLLTRASISFLGLNGGYGEAIIANGATVVGGTLVGLGAGSVGKMTVTGFGTSAQIAGIGGSGTGSVIVKDRAIAQISGDIGTGPGGHGTLWVSDANASVGEDLYVGLAGGTGVLKIDSGGEVSIANDMFIGSAMNSSNASAISQSSTGLAMVSGNGSRLNVGHDLVVGKADYGELEIADGGMVNASADLIIGQVFGEQQEARGAVSVSGRGSQLFVGANMFVGASADGMLTLSDGGEAWADTLTVGQFANSSGVVNIGSASGEAATGAGILHAERLIFGEGDGELVFNHTAERYDFSTAVEGNGLILQEAGYTRLTGDFSAFTGVAEVRGGVLAIDTDFGQAVTVKQGGAIGGTGSAGDVVFEDGSRFEVELGDNFLNTSTLTIGEGVFVGISAESRPQFRVGDVYTIIDWSDAPVDGEFAGLDGTFAGVDENFAFLDTFLEQVANSFVIRFERTSAAFADVALTRNQKATAEGIETLGSGEVYDAVLHSSAAEARAGFDEMSGELHASVVSGQLEGGGVIRGALKDRMVAVTDPVSINSLAFNQEQDFDESIGAVRHWVSVLDGQAKFATDGNAAELITTSGGLLVGADVLYDDWLLGAAVGVSNSIYAVDDRASSADSDNFHVALYGAGEMGPATLRGGLAYGFQQVSTERNISFAGLDQDLTSDYNIHSLQAFGEIGFRVDTAVATFEPFVGFAANLIGGEGYQETGGNAALEGGAELDTSYLVTLGLRTDRTVTLFGQDVLLHGSVAWQHAVGERDTSVTHRFNGSDDFTVYGVPLTLDAAVVDAGVRLPISQQATLGVSYRGVFGVGTDDQSFNTRLDVRF